MNRAQWIAIALIGAFVAAEALVYAAPAPNNCGVNMLCRIRTLIVSGSASFNGGAVFDGGTTYNGDLTVNGDAGVTGNVNVVGTLIGGVVDGGTVAAGALSVSGKASIANLAVTAATDLKSGTLDGAGTASVTVRAAAKCFCWDGTVGVALTCTLSGTTLSVSGGVAADAYYVLCPTAS